MPPPPGHDFTGQVSAAVDSSELTRPNLTIPLFFDDTMVDGLSGAMLATFLANVLNAQNIYPFYIDLRIHFDCM